MTKEELLKKVMADGYAVGLTINEDCLYCSATDTNYLLENFAIENEFPFEENGVKKVLRTVSSTEYQLTGFYII